MGGEGIAAERRNVGAREEAQEHVLPVSVAARPAVAAGVDVRESASPHPWGGVVAYLAPRGCSWRGQLHCSWRPATATVPVSWRPATATVPCHGRPAVYSYSDLSVSLLQSCSGPKIENSCKMEITRLDLRGAG